MKIIIILNLFITSLLLASCNVGVYNKNESNNKNVVISENDATVNDDVVKPLFEIEPIGNNIGALYNGLIAVNVMTEYNDYLQKILEREYDGREYDFVSSDQSFISKISLKETFKIVEYNTYCREYYQDIEYMSDILSFSSISCRSNDGLWHNLVKNN